MRVSWAPDSQPAVGVTVRLSEEDKSSPVFDSTEMAAEPSVQFDNQSFDNLDEDLRGDVETICKLKNMFITQKDHLFLCL